MLLIIVIIYSISVTSSGISAVQLRSLSEAAVILSMACHSAKHPLVSTSYLQSATVNFHLLSLKILPNVTWRPQMEDGWLYKGILMIKKQKPSTRDGVIMYKDLEILMETNCGMV